MAVPSNRHALLRSPLATAIALAALRLQHQPLRVLDAFLDPDQEADGLAAVDDAVVVGEGQVHHRADHDLVVDDDGPLLDGVHAEDAALGRVEDRRGEERAEDAAVGDREGAALEVVDGDRPFAGLARRRRRWPSRSRRSDMLSASRSTGTIRPASVLTATPMS